MYLEPEMVRSRRWLSFRAAMDTAVRIDGYVRVSKIQRTEPLYVSLTCILNSRGALGV